jgi:hypothetical protein
LLAASIPRRSTAKGDGAIPSITASATVTETVTASATATATLTETVTETPTQTATAIGELPPGGLKTSGCMRLYWSQPTSFAVWPAPHTPSSFVRSVLSLPMALLPNGQLDLNSDGLEDTLFDALNYSGYDGLEGAARLLLSEAVVGTLIAAYPDLPYPFTAEQIISQTTTALTGSELEMILLARTLLLNNDLGCLPIEPAGLAESNAVQLDAPLVQVQSVPGSGFQNGGFETGNLEGWTVEARQHHQRDD